MNADWLAATTRVPGRPGTLRKGVAARYWPKVRKTATCWLWIGRIDSRGYGRFGGGPRALRMSTLAHRVAYELAIGPIPTGLELDHLCHGWDQSCVGGPTCPHRRCVNPAHLEPVTTAENAKRGGWARRTRCQAGHLYDEANTRQCPDGRRCRACHRLSQNIARSPARRMLFWQLSDLFRQAAYQKLWWGTQDPETYGSWSP